MNNHSPKKISLLCARGSQYKTMEGNDSRVSSAGQSTPKWDGKAREWGRNNIPSGLTPSSYFNYTENTVNHIQKQVIKDDNPSVMSEVPSLPPASDSQSKEVKEKEQ